MAWLSFTLKVSPSTALTAPIFRRMKMPRVTGKCFCRSVTLSSTSPLDAALAGAAAGAVVAVAAGAVVDMVAGGLETAAGGSGWGGGSSASDGTRASGRRNLSTRDSSPGGVVSVIAASPPRS